MSESKENFIERNFFEWVGRAPLPLPFEMAASFDINTYLLLPAAGSHGLTMIDTGVKTPPALDALTNSLECLGYRFQDIDNLILTHGHLDHYGQALRIQEMSGARVYAGALTKKQVETDFYDIAGAGDYEDWYRRWGVPTKLFERDRRNSGFIGPILDSIKVDQVVEDGEELKFSGHTLKFLFTPGHCDDHMVVWNSDSKTLFSGDHLLTDITPVPMLVIPEEGCERPRSVPRFMKSLEKVEVLPCEVVFPAHGDVIYDHRALIDRYRRHHDARKLVAAKCLREGPLTPFEVASRMFEVTKFTQVYLILSEAIGHLDLLEGEGWVRVEERKGIDVAELTPHGVAMLDELDAS